MGALENIGNYIGISYAEKDCYQLIKLFYREQLSKHLPNYDLLYDDSNDAAETKPVIENSIASGKWLKVDEPEQFDVIVFNLAGLPVHCGMNINGKDFLHSLYGCNSVIESLESITWQRRVYGYYRWVS